MFKLNYLLLVVGLLVSLVAAEPEKREERIFKGAYDNSNEHRYHVAILKVLEDDSTEHICGGAIIDSRFVLTAAHCVYEVNKDDLILRAGWNQNPGQAHLEKRSYHKVAKVMYLKDYVYSGCRHHEHDIALIKVKKNFDLTDDVNFKKVNLPEFDNDYEAYPATFTGYGVERIALVKNKTSGTLKKLFKYPESLKFLNTQVIPLEECKKVAEVIVTNSNICTNPQNPNGFSCVGDSGGPLVYEDVVVGIRNSHNNECIHNQPEMFTRVSSYLDFIQKVLNSEPAAEILYV